MHGLPADPLPHAQSAPKKARNGTATKWQQSAPQYTWTAPTNGTEDRQSSLKTKFAGKSPSEIFFTIFDDEVLTQIIVQSGTYAKQKNEHGFSLTSDDLKKFLGILLLSGYHRLPSQRMYWSLDEDVGVPCVFRCMPRTTFLDIKRFLHFADNNAIVGTTDRMYKVRPLMHLLNKKFQQHGVFHRNLSIDESMVKYFGHHPCKQFIRGKPIRFGYKNWMLCSSDGYCYAFDTYCGKSSISENLPLGSRVVLSFCENISTPSDHILYFDNFFTGIDLLATLRMKGFRATGTIRENRLKNAPLPAKKEMEKRDRGYFASCFDTQNEVLLVKWRDSSVVTMATNYDSVQPIGAVSRWSSSKKEKVKVAQPSVFGTYNNGMGGVDLLDQTANNYRIGIRSKKWWWVLFTQMLNISVVNAWRIHQMSSENRLDLLAFTRLLTRHLLRLGVQNRNQRRTPASVPTDIIFDPRGHYPRNLGKQLRCKVCHMRAMWECEKCECTLCLERGCFKKFHEGK